MVMEPNNPFVSELIPFLIGIITALAGGILWKVWQLKEPYGLSPDRRTISQATFLDDTLIGGK